MKPNVWEYELKALIGLQALKLKSPAAVIDDCKNRPQQYAYLDFQDERYANIFGLCVQKNAFPLDEGNKVVSPLHYGIRFWSGAYSLKEYRSLLHSRKTVMIFPLHDYYNYGAGQNSRDDKIIQYMKNVATTAKSDGRDPSEVIVCCTGGEELYQILAGFALAERGYIIFPEYDFGMTNNFLSMYGVPDMVAIKLGDFQDRLVGEGLIELGGWFHEIELSLCLGRPARRPGRRGSATGELSLAIEVEDTAAEASNGYKQLQGYRRSGYFDSCILVCPKRSVKTRLPPISSDGFGGLRERNDFLLMTWDDQGVMSGPRFASQECYSDKDRKDELLQLCRRLITSNIRKVKNYPETGFFQESDFLL